MFENAGKATGTEAAGKLADAAKEVGQGLATAADHLGDDVQQSIKTAVDGIADGIGQIVATVLRLDGATLQTNGIEISVKIANPSVTLNLGPYRPE